MSHVLGDDWYDQIDDHMASTDSKNPGSKSGAITDRAKALYKALVAQPFNKAACTPRKIENPGYLTTMEEQAELLEAAKAEADDNAE